MSTPHQYTRGRPAAAGNRTETAEASRASMRRELARAGLAESGSPSRSGWTAAVARTNRDATARSGGALPDPQANMRRQLARAGHAPTQS